jgi:hypothetical protein
MILQHTSKEGKSLNSYSIHLKGASYDTAYSRKGQAIFLSVLLKGDKSLFLHHTSKRGQVIIQHTSKRGKPNSYSILLKVAKS